MSAILATLPKLGSDEVELSLEDEDSAVDVETQEAAEASSNGLAKGEVVNKEVTIITVTVVVAEEEEAPEDDGSDGRIMTSLSAIEMRLSMSSRTGRCWKRSISIVCRN